jgi:hypothetical protein
MKRISQPLRLAVLFIGLAIFNVSSSMAQTVVDGLGKHKNPSSSYAETRYVRP